MCNQILLEGQRTKHSEGQEDMGRLRRQVSPEPCQTGTPHHPQSVKSGCRQTLQGDGTFGGSGQDQRSAAPWSAALCAMPYTSIFSSGQSLIKKQFRIIRSQ